MSQEGTRVEVADDDQLVQRAVSLSGSAPLWTDTPTLQIAIPPTGTG